jgi:hypothetical protein
MGLKKRSLSRSGAACHAIIATKDQQLGVSAKSAEKKDLGFFRHFAWQASGSREACPQVNRRAGV